MKRLLLFNPNSSEAVTARIQDAVAPLVPHGIELRCETVRQGPPAIETQADVDASAISLRRALLDEVGHAEAFIIACFADPGLYAVREAVTSKPVFGIAQSAFAAASALVDRFGIIAILERSIPRHRRMLASLALLPRLAGERAAGLGVAALSGDAVLDRLEDVGRRLRDEDGAEAVILGCAGMAHHRMALEDRLSVPVLDPCQCAVGLAVAHLQSRISYGGGR